jgi:ATP-dependent DNA ligase
MELLQTEDGLDLIIPMKAVGTTKEKLKDIIASPLWTCDFKLDGHFFVAYINYKPIDDYKTRFFSRNVSVETGYFSERTPHLKDLVKFANEQFSAYGPMIITGEIVHFLGKDIVTSVVGGNPEHAWKRQKELGRPVFCPFDLLAYDGEWLGNCALESRKGLLRSICEDVGMLWITDKNVLDNPSDERLWRLTPTLEMCQECFHGEDKSTFTKKDMWEWSLEHGFEGLVHKRLASLYIPGYISNDTVRVRGSKDWIKQKVKREFDVVIMSFTDARFGRTGQFEGMVGAVVFGQYKDGELVEIGQASGFDVATRQDMTDHPEKYIGKVAVVEAQERSSARDRLRHAQYKGLRDDKRPIECIYDENEA